jgi:Undecaprenyl-phosphate glucose phosphotransferase
MHYGLSDSDVTTCMRLGDCLAILLAGLLAYTTRFLLLADHYPQLELYALLVGVFVAAETFQVFGIYDKERLQNFRVRLKPLLMAWAFVVLLVLALGFLTRTAQAASRIWVGLWFSYGLVCLVLAQLLYARQIGRWHRSGRLSRRIAVLGAGELGQRLIRSVRAGGGGAVRIAGVFDDRRTRIAEGPGDVWPMGTVDDLVTFARGNWLDQVVIALPDSAEDRLAALVKKLRDLPVEVSLCSTVFQPKKLVCLRVTQLGNLPVFMLLKKPFSRWGYLQKCVLDFVLAAVLLVLAAPVMLLVALAVRLDSPGPVLFRQKRYGFNNETIEVLKFRTMRTEHGQGGEGRVVQARRGDPRVTRLGRFLRRTSLDELPQLFNVLKGEMSLVGPRPHAVVHNEQYAPLIEAYLARHRVKPGITGWAQVNGYRGGTETLEKMEKRIEYDLYYIENWSLGLDVRILLRTVLVGFTHQNAY